MDVHTLDDHPGGWHTNRVSWRAILVSHLAILCRDPKRFGCTPDDKGCYAPTCMHRLRAVLELRHKEGAGHNHNPIRGSRQGHRRFFERG